jgi:ribosomal protein S18 acetylase RimI-like enzyme
MTIRDRLEDDIPWMRALLLERWNGTTMYVHGETIDVMVLPALVAGEREGLATYRVMDGEAELVSLDAVSPGQGVGTRLLAALTSRLRQQSVRRLWVTTTNNNLAALAFYQKRGFKLQRVRPGAVDETRRLKPGIPPIGENGIPIRDELELCLDLSEAAS